MPARTHKPRRTGRYGIKLIKHFEGCRLVGYRDPVGVPTIGWGHTGPDVWIGKHISQAQADRLLAEDLEYFEDAVNDLVTVPLSQFEFDALVSFAYNAGTGSLASSTLLRKLNRGNRRSVPRQLMRWVYAGGTVFQGLVRRRRAEGKLFRRRKRGKPLSTRR